MFTQHGEEEQHRALVKAMKDVARWGYVLATRIRDEEHSLGLRHNAWYWTLSDYVRHRRKHAGL